MGRNGKGGERGRGSRGIRGNEREGRKWEGEREELLLGDGRPCFVMYFEL